MLPNPHKSLTAGANLACLNQINRALRYPNLLLHARLCSLLRPAPPVVETLGPIFASHLLDPFTLDT